MLVEEITKLVVQELQKERKNTNPTKNEAIIEHKQSKDKVTLYGKTNTNHVVAKNESSKDIIPLYKEQVSNKLKQSEKFTSGNEKAEEIQDTDVPVKLKIPANAEEDRLLTETSEYLKYTPARVGVGRAGSRPKTTTLLKFRYDHAAAVDAVYGEVTQQLLDKLDLFTVETKVEEKEEYIRRPDLGRRLSEESKKLIKERCEFSPVVQIVASNGLSASAVNTNLEDVYRSLQQSLQNLNIQMGTTFYAHQGRVGLMDDIGEVLEPEVVINLIGERPGLVSAESLSAYLCYKPHHGTIESERMVISNIHKGGIPPIEAGAYLGTVIQRILKHKASGVQLIQKEG